MVLAGRQDRSHREQLTVVTGYLRPDNQGHWHCYEDPVAVLDIYAAIKNIKNDQSEHGEAKLSGKAIGNTLLQTVGKLGLSLSSCVGQGYDGTAALSSERVGAAACIKEVAAHAHYFHCSMHCLNLSASKAVIIPALRHTEDIVKEASSFFKSSAKRTDVKCAIEELADSRTSKTNLASLCTMRFTERHTAVVTFRCLLRYILVALDKISTWQSSEARKAALSLKNSITRS